MFVLFLVFLCTGLLSAGRLDLPSYVSKCSLSGPNVNQCIVEKGNPIIPRIAKGDHKLAIPSLSPLYLSEMSMKGDDLEMKWFDVYTDDLKNFRLKNVSIIVRPDAISFLELHTNSFTMIGKNYNIISGNILGIPAYGNGNFNMTLVGVTIKTLSRLSAYEKNGENYIYVELQIPQTNITRAYYHFENIRSPYIDDVNAYIEENWEEFTRQMLPAITTQLGAFTNYPVHMVTSKLPVNVLYLP